MNTSKCTLGHSYLLPGHMQPAEYTCSMHGFWLHTVLCKQVAIAVQATDPPSILTVLWFV